MSGIVAMAMWATLDLRMFRAEPPGWPELLRDLPVTMTIAMFVVGVGLVLGLLAGVNLRKRDRAVAGGLSRRFARQLGLPRRDRRLVQRIARLGGLRFTASLLLSEGCFDSVMERVVLSPADRARLIAIREAVFATDGNAGDQTTA